MTPNEIAAQDTLDFLLPHLKNNIRLLEVGCGQGHLALLLSNHGIQTRAIDIAEEAIVSSKEKNIDAIQADFLNYEDNLFDVILFSRSLHHITPLEQAVAKAHALLKPHGFLLLEDFAAELANETSIDWLKQKQQIIGLPYKFDSLKDWQEHHYHKHKIAESEEMINTIQKLFSKNNVERTAYLYRYIVQALENENNSQFVKNILVEEKKLISKTSLVPIGLRIVAVK
jgi:ubiquinone/menaquinone biosynthesis C-methylase UbiE